MKSVWLFFPPKARFDARGGVCMVARCVAFLDRTMTPWLVAIQRFALVSARMPSGAWAFRGSLANIFLLERVLSLFIL